MEILGISRDGLHLILNVHWINYIAGSCYFHISYYYIFHCWTMDTMLMLILHFYFISIYIAFIFYLILNVNLSLFLQFYNIAIKMFNYFPSSPTNRFCNMEPFISFQKPILNKFLVSLKFQFLQNIKVYLGIQVSYLL